MAYILLDEKGDLVCGGDKRYSCFTHLPHGKRDKIALKMIESGYTVLSVYSGGFENVTEKMVRDINQGNSRLN